MSVDLAFFSQAEAMRLRKTIIVSERGSRSNKREEGRKRPVRITLINIPKALATGGTIRSILQTFTPRRALSASLF